MTQSTDQQKNTETKTEQVVLPPKVSRFKKIFGKIKTYLESRQPSTGFVIFVSVCTLILLGLGSWQMQRLEQKNTLLVQIKKTLNDKLHDKTILFPKTNKAWLELNYRPVALRGKWVSLHQFKMIPRTYEGQVGYHLLWPLQLKDNQTILVNRGFVPSGQAVLPPQDKKVTIQAILMELPKDKPWQTAENIPSRNLWTWVDLPAFKHEMGVKDMAPVIAYELRKSDQDEYPIGGQLPVPMNNRHAQYALTWFTLALSLLVIAFLASGPQNKKTKKIPSQSKKIADPVAARGLYPEATD